VRQFNYALEHASKALRSDWEVVLTAVSHNTFAIHYASDEIRTNENFVLQAAHVSCTYEWANDGLDRALVFQALARRGKDLEFEFTNPEMRVDRGGAVC